MRLDFGTTTIVRYMVQLHGSSSPSVCSSCVRLAVLGLCVLDQKEVVRGRVKFGKVDKSDGVSSVSHGRTTQTRDEFGH